MPHEQERMYQSEPEIMLVSLWRSYKFVKYVAGSELMKEMEMLIRRREGELKNI